MASEVQHLRQAARFRQEIGIKIIRNINVKYLIKEVFCMLTGKEILAIYRVDVVQHICLEILFDLQ